MKTTLSLASASLLTLIVASTGAAQAETLRLAHESSSNSLIQEAAQHFADTLSEKTGGDLTVQIFPDGQLGDEASIVDGVGYGSIDIGLGGVVDPIDPKLNVITLPFLFKDLDSVHAFLDGETGKKLFDTGADKGFHMLGALDSGFRQFALTKGPVTQPSDLEGVKIRVPGNPVLLATLKALGALPQSIPFGEVYTSLQSGIVDGTEPELRDFADQKWYETTKYVSMANYVWTPNYWFMNDERYESLSEKDRKAFDEAVTDTIDWYRNELNETYAGVRKLLEENDVKINDVDQAPFREMVAPVYAQFSEEWGADLVKSVREAAAAN